MSRASEIIVVDDDMHLREMIEEYLQRFAFAVRGAANGQELDLRLAAAKPDLIILDVNMPLEDGFSILRRMRACCREAQREKEALALPPFRRRGRNSGVRDRACG
jgi:DNA-binding response OmpR family regulator